jgi:hypothetical protein
MFTCGLLRSNFSFAMTALFPCDVLKLVVQTSVVISLRLSSVANIGVIP